MLSVPALAAGAALTMAASAAAETRVVDYPENAVTRVAAFSPADAAWTLSGADAPRFVMDGGVLRFARTATGVAFLPDFESPADADGDGRYRVRLTAGVAGRTRARDVTVRIADRDEQGRATLSLARPGAGRTLTASLADPDGAAGVVWSWARSAGPGVWTVIPGAHGAHYAATAADAGHHLRASALYADRFGAGKRVEVVTVHPVTGPLLTGFTAVTDRARADPTVAMKPAFRPDVLHYSVGCNEADTMMLALTAPPSARLAVSAVQPRPPVAATGAAVPVSGDSRVTVSVSDATGAATVYAVHCAPDPLVRLRARHGPGAAGGPGALMAVAAGPWIVLLDEHGVPRMHRRASAGTPGSAKRAGFYLMSFGEGAEQRWAHALPSKETEWQWRVLDRDFRHLRTVTAAAPLVRTGRHDFTLLANGDALIMSYEPAVRDFSALAFPDRDGNPWGEAVETRDSAIQIVRPDGTARWTWNSWGRMPLEDCAQHRFPDDWAHVSSARMTADGRVLAGFRGCSSVMLLDPAAPAGEEIVWRLGATNLEPEDWAARGLGPEPLRLVGDPEGAFCGQHAALLLPNGHLLLYDNGVACVVDPETREPLGREGERYSRAVEYAIDEANGEAVFVRAHSLHGRRDMLGRVAGHVAVLPDGAWLVSWGWPPGEGAPAPPHGPDEAVTRIDPATGAETFSLSDLVAEGVPSGTLRAVPVSPLALLPEPAPLAADLPDGAPAGHGGAGARFEVAVAFSRPVPDPAAATPSVAVTGGRLVAVSPLRAFGRPAHLHALAIVPDGEGPVTLALLPGLACDTGAVCAADGTRLTAVPEAVAVPFAGDGGGDGR